MMSEQSTHDPHAAEHGNSKYIAVFVALCVLTGASFFTYSDYWMFHDTPAVGWVFMMAVSCTKAMLVILFFMHVKYEANWKYVLTIPPAIMAIFLMLALVPDIGMRLRTASEERLRHMAPIRTTAAAARENQSHGAASHGAGSHDDKSHQDEAAHDEKSHGEESHATDEASSQ